MEGKLAGALGEIANLCGRRKSPSDRDRCLPPQIPCGRSLAAKALAFQAWEVGAAPTVRSKNRQRMKHILLEKYHYDPLTGIFSNKKSGKRAGWLCNGYRVMNVDNQQYYEHILAFVYMTGNFPEEEVDHINRKKNDNRWENLRISNRSANNINKSVRKDSSSGIKGVKFDPKREKWEVRIQAKKIRKFVGYFPTKEEAIKARANAESILHTEYAGLVDG